jgi:NNP family nitrate/nitrite transporter-like MFS transporter
MAGGIGGFYLASSLGFAKQLTGSFQPGFLIFAGLSLAAFVGLAIVKGKWRNSWGAAANGVRI